MGSRCLLSAVAALALICAAPARAQTKTPPQLTASTSIASGDLFLVWPTSLGGPLHQVQFSVVESQLVAALTPTFQPALGFAPVNKAGDTMTGQLYATQFNVSGSGASFGNNNGTSNPVLGFAPNWFIDFSSTDGLRIFAGGDYALQITPTYAEWRENPSYLPQTFASLQSAPNYGQEAYITDCPMPPAGNYGVAVTSGGGTYHCKVWWNAHDGKWVIG